MESGPAAASGPWCRPRREAVAVAECGPRCRAVKSGDQEVRSVASGSQRPARASVERRQGRGGVRAVKVWPWRSPRRRSGPWLPGWPWWRPGRMQVGAVERDGPFSWSSICHSYGLKRLTRNRTKLTPTYDSTMHSQICKSSGSMNEKTPGFCFSGFLIMICSV